MIQQCIHKIDISCCGNNR